MWSIRILSGELAGKTFPLKAGTNTIGRVASCDVVFPTPGISKHHAQIEVLADKIIVTDLNSRNGTFIDGVSIKSQVLREGKKIAIYDVICEVIASKTLVPKIKSPRAKPKQDGFALAANAYQGSLAVANAPAYDVQAQATQIEEKAQPQTEKGLAGYVEHYINNVIMPTVYKIPMAIEFKNVMIIFGLVLVVSITALSTIPLTKILKKKIEKTSQQRALTIAKTLAIRNQPILAAGQMTGLTTTESSNEPGVSKSFIINLEGRILAPTVLAQRDTEIPFVAEARRFGKEVVRQIDDSTIGALVPIVVPNDQGYAQAMAHAVVMYDMGSLAVDDGQTFSLFVQTLAIALVLGAIVFFFLYKIILYPIANLNLQLSAALRDGNSTLNSEYQFPELQELTTNIQSLVARGGAGGGGFEGPGAYEHERSGEAFGVTSLIGFPSIAVRSTDLQVISVNPQFQDQIGKATAWNQLSLDNIMDQALKLNLLDIVERAKASPSQTASNEIDVDGLNFQVTGQAIFGSKDVSYILIAFIPKGGG